ncbi:MAG TPA: hypothetical protein VK607_04525 [Kofleriaceae bacterium]|nr:hypothetical protein [Kofleriaceae bacterium]
MKEVRAYVRAAMAGRVVAALVADGFHTFSILEVRGIADGVPHGLDFSIQLGDRYVPACIRPSARTSHVIERRRAALAAPREGGRQRISSRYAAGRQEITVMGAELWRVVRLPSCPPPPPWATLGALLRALLTLLVVITALAVSGLSSAFASSFGSDQCCAAECSDEASGDQPCGDHSSKSPGSRGCSPVCHACACAPAFAPPAACSTTFVVHSIEMNQLADVASQLPISPPGDDIFHPPRLSAW